MPRKDASPAKVAELAAALKTLLPIDRNFYEADVKVTMRYALTGNAFEVTVAGLSGPAYDAIKPGETSVRISLGYYGGSDEQVLEGVIQKKSAKAGDGFYETTLTGVEKSFHLLQTTCLDQKFQENTDIEEILNAIKAAAGIGLAVRGDVAGATIPRNWSFDKRTAKDALEQIHDRLRRINGYSLTVRDGSIWYGRANGQVNNAGMVMTDPVYSYDNYLVKTDPVDEVRGGQRNLCATESKKETKPLGYTFKMLGDPRLRPGDTVTFRIKIHDKDQLVEKPIRLTIESITHDYSRSNGYVCTGRALDAKTFLENVFSSMAPGSESVGEEVNNMLARNQDRFPAVNVGDITQYTPAEHLVNAKLGLQFEPQMTSPSVQVRREAKGFTLERRPMVSPFAWNLCGLIVPVYPGMRAVAVHNRYLREDALLSGFIWTEEMQTPPSQAGDYWLCLPLNVPDNQAPNTNDKAANDLTTGDGKRAIELKGLRIGIGTAKLKELGVRPSLGADDELLIEIGSEAKITMTANKIELKAGGRTVDISGGKVNVT